MAIDLTYIILERIKELSAKSKLSQRRLARALGITPPYMWKILNRKSPLKVDDISVLCSEFGWDPCDLILPTDSQAIDLVKSLDPEHWNEFEHLKAELTELRDLNKRMEEDSRRHTQLITKLTEKLMGLDGK